MCEKNCGLCPITDFSIQAADLKIYHCAIDPENAKPFDPKQQLVIASKSTPLALDGFIKKGLITPAILLGHLTPTPTNRIVESDDPSNPTTSI